MFTLATWSLHYSMVLGPGVFPGRVHQVSAVVRALAPSSRVPTQGLSACRLALYTRVLALRGRCDSPRAKSRQDQPR